MNMETQICRDCGKTKTINHFIRHKGYQSGRTRVCKPCNMKRCDERTWDKNKGLSALEHSIDELSVKGAEVVLNKMQFELYNHDNTVYEQFKERIEKKYGITLES